MGYVPECLRALGSVARAQFRCTRHPANWGPLVVVLRFRHLTVNRATLAVLSVAYLVTGSIHEEYRLLAAHRRPYQRYQSRVPFLLGGTRKLGSVNDESRAG